MQKEEIEKRISEIESAMLQIDFWNDKDKAQAMIRELQDLKDDLEGASKYDKGGAHMTVFAGAGGDDAEDFARMLVQMYMKYVERKGWRLTLLNQNQNDHGGFRNITFEIIGKNVYGNLKHESGVHRLVRISPFNAKSQRHTSFAMVEVIPKFEKATDFVIDEKEIEVDFSRSSGPGGQNVNKRDTAVRIVHLPTKISVHVETERSQLQNKEKAMELLRGKLFKLKQEQVETSQQGMYISKTTDAEWGSQIRSYVLHPYKMVKDHRTDFEVRDVDAVLNGNIDEFIEEMKKKTGGV